MNSNWQPQFETIQKVKPEAEGSKLFRVSEVISARRSLEYFKHFVVDGNKRVEESKALELGTMLHAKLLEPKKFADSYITPDQIDVEALPETIDELSGFMLKYQIANPKGKRKPDLIAAIRERFPGFKTRNEMYANLIDGKKLLDPQTYQIVNEMAEALRTKAQTDKFLDGAIVEERLYGKISDRNWHVTGQPDFYNMKFLGNGEIALFDLKTTKSVSRREFRKSVYNYGYHIQAAAYADLVSKANGDRPVIFSWLAVESYAPYSVGVFVADQEMLDAGRSAFRGLLRKIDQGFETGVWPGPAGVDPVDLELEGWMVQETFTTYQEEIFS